MRLSIVPFAVAMVVVTYLVDVITADDELFKINKLNLVWSKAKHSLGLTKLKDLKYDLTRHEVEELALKTMKAHGQDKDGLFEAATRKKLLSILSKYSLERYYDDIHPASHMEHSLKRDNLDPAKLSNADVAANQKSTFRDKKLDKLWRKAEQSGFTQEQLMVLYEEFEHQQDKIDEHYDTMNQLEQEIEKKAKKLDTGENTLEEDSEMPKETAGEKKARLEVNIHQTVKDKYGNIKMNYDKLHKKIANRAIELNDGPFQEEQVNKLWLAAKEVNFNQKDLESFKDELSHYETRIKKLRHFENLLERDDIGSKDSYSSLNNHELKHVRKRVEELNQKVEKSYLSLKKKIERKRDEL